MREKSGRQAPEWKTVFFIGDRQEQRGVNLMTYAEISKFHTFLSTFPFANDDMQL